MGSGEVSGAVGELAGPAGVKDAGQELVVLASARLWRSVFCRFPKGFGAAGSGERQGESELSPSSSSSSRDVVHLGRGDGESW